MFFPSIRLITFINIIIIIIIVTNIIYGELVVLFSNIFS